MKKAICNTLVFLFFICCYLPGANAQKEDFHIPPDLGVDNRIILVAPASKDKVTESILDAFSDIYKGKYEATANRYPDKNKLDQKKYQYIFFVWETISPARYIGKDRFPETTNYKFGLVDVKTGQTYEQDFWSGSYKKGAKNFIKQMEEARKKNSGL
jgi:hypothetical protein